MYRVFVSPSSPRPANMFGPGKMYHPLLYFFLIGAVAPAIPYVLAKRFPNSWIKYVNMPVLLNGTSAIPPATAVNFIPASLVGFIFNRVIRRRHFSWWSKYNCERILSSFCHFPRSLTKKCCNFPRRTFRGAGLWCRCVIRAHLFYSPISQGRRHRSQYRTDVVGQHGVRKNQ